MHIETGGRPSELLALRIKDIEIKTSSSTGKKYAEFRIGQFGKSRKARPATISDAIPYWNIWRAVHPQRDDSKGNAYIFPSMEKSAKYYNKPLAEGSLRLLYHRTLKKHFPKLLERPDVSLEEKETIKRLLKKPHYPYLRRHEFGTAMAPKVPSFVFNQLGHSKNSRIGNEVYVQELGDEGIREFQIAKGIISREESLSPVQVEMQPKYCPICHESNKYDADFCFKCNWIISKKGVQETKEKDEVATREAEQNKQELQKMKAKSEEQDAKIQIMMTNLVSMMEHLTGVKKRGKEEEQALEIIPTTPPPELIKDEKEEKEFLFSAAKVARERFKERGEENKATFTMRWKEPVPTPPSAVEQ